MEFGAARDGRGQLAVAHYPGSSLEVSLSNIRGTLTKTGATMTTGGGTVAGQTIAAGEIAPNTAPAGVFSTAAGAASFVTPCTAHVLKIDQKSPGWVDLHQAPSRFGESAPRTVARQGTYSGEK
jgi:hypothetical protein